MLCNDLLFSFEFWSPNGMSNSARTIPVTATCYFLLNFGHCKSRTHWATRAHLAIFFWILGTPVSVIWDPTEDKLLAIFFWILGSWFARALDRTRASILPCYFLLNFGQILAGRKAPTSTSIALAIFFWILDGMSQIVVFGRDEDVQLAIFFWILAEQALVFLIKLLRSVNRPCYFLLNFGVALIVITPKPSADETFHLLFSFEFWELPIAAFVGPRLLQHLLFSFEFWVWLLFRWKVFPRWI